MFIIACGTLEQPRAKKYEAIVPLANDFLGLIMSKCPSSGRQLRFN
jgi:hypothetical protein